MAEKDNAFANLDGSLDDDAALDLNQDPGGQNAGDDAIEVDEGFADLLSASETIEIEVAPGFEDEAPAAQQPAAEEEEDPDDDSKLSDAMKRRLQRAKRVAEAEVEQRVRGEVEQEFTTLRSENETLKQRVSQAPQAGAGTQQPAEPQQLLALRQQLDEARKTRRKAKLEGDDDAEETADEQVLKLNREIGKWELAIDMQRQQQAQRTAQQQPAQQQQPAKAAPDLHPNAKQWGERNATWYGKAGYEEATAKAREIDADLWRKGYRPEDPDYFTELDRRLKKDGIKKPSEAAAASGNAGGSHVAPASNGAASGGTQRQNNSNAGNGNQRVVRLSADDVRMMRSVKLDPNNREHVQAFLRG